jgi:hypothetical protein
VQRASPLVSTPHRDLAGTPPRTHHLARLAWPGPHVGQAQSGDGKELTARRAITRPCRHAPALHAAVPAGYTHGAAALAIWEGGKELRQGDSR